MAYAFVWGGVPFKLENTGPASLWQAPVVTHAQLPPMIPHMPAPQCATGYMPAHFMSLGINFFLETSTGGTVSFC